MSNKNDNVTALFETFNFNNKAVLTWERKNGRDLSTLCSGLFDDIITLIKLGTGMSDDEALDFAIKVKKEHDIDNQTLTFELMRTLQRDGFFPKTVDISVMETAAMTHAQTMMSKLANNPQTIQFPETV